MTASSSFLLTQWKTVPTRVAELLPTALHIKHAHVAAAEPVFLTGRTYVTWRPDTDMVTVYGVELPTKTAQETYRAKLGRPCVFQLAAQPDWDHEILVKKAGLPGIAPAFDFAKKMLGGPTPLANGIITGLAAGGLGYGAGALLENLFPERYVERGKLRKTLGLLGAGTGLGVGAIGAHANAKANDTSFWQGWLIPNDSTPKYRLKRSNFEWQGSPQVPGNSGIMAPSVDIQRMNEAIWNDAQKGFYNGFQQHTPPAYAATAAGFMTGLGTGLQSPIIRPVDVINGIASAGVGLATATVAGKALSAMAGLTPMAQEKLQDMGLWGGMMHAIVPSMLGFR